MSSGADRGRFGRGPPEAGDYATNLACWHRCGIVELACSCIGLACKSPGVQSSNRSATYDWSGFYLGVNFGGGWSNGSLNIPGNNLYGGLTEFIGGVQAGYNFQAGHLLFGVEGDFDWAGFGHPVLSTPTLGYVDQHWIGTVAGRVGLVNDRWLLFATNLAMTGNYDSLTAKCANAISPSVT